MVFCATRRTSGWVFGSSTSPRFSAMAVATSTASRAVGTSLFKRESDGSSDGSVDGSYGLGGVVPLVGWRGATTSGGVVPLPGWGGATSRGRDWWRGATSAGGVTPLAAGLTTYSLDLLRRRFTKRWPARSRSAMIRITVRRSSPVRRAMSVRLGHAPAPSSRARSAITTSTSRALGRSGDGHSKTRPTRRPLMARQRTAAPGA